MNSSAGDRLRHLTHSICTHHSTCTNSCTAGSLGNTPVGAAEAAVLFPPPDADGGWPQTFGADEARAAAGLDIGRLEQAFEYCRRSTPHGGLAVIRHGKLAFERYFGRAHRDSNPDMASTGKAFCSVACGIMLEEFKDRLPQGLATKVYTEEYLPSEAFPLDDHRKADITLGQLLCMTAGMHGEGMSPGVVNGKVQALKAVANSTFQPAIDAKFGFNRGGNLQDISQLDMSSITAPLWIEPGGGYSYSSPSPHVASIVLRRVTGLDLKDYIEQKLARPMGWGAWDYCHRWDVPSNGAGSIALHATDALRFGYCLLHNGRWGEQQLVPAEYVKLCGTPSPFNPHAPWSLQFENNSDLHVIGAPTDAFWKSGAGGFCLYIVPSLDMVIYKLGGATIQYDPAQTKVDPPQPFSMQDASRDNWQPAETGPFNEGAGSLNRLLEMVVAAVVTN